LATAGNIGKDLHREIVIVIKYEVKGTENFKTVMISLSRGYTSALRKYDAIMHPHDSGYTHSERANVSFLAAAAWKKGWVAIQEPIFYKNKEEKSSRGRADLIIQYKPNGKTRLSFGFEAKQKWPASYKSSDVQRRALESAWESAIKDARRSFPEGKPDYIIHYGCALLFLTPSLKDGRKEASAGFEKVFWHFFNNSVATVHNNACAFFVPTRHPSAAWNEFKDGKRYFPGVGVIIVAVKR
jgi:hypothetical protein